MEIQLSEIFSSAYDLLDNIGFKIPSFMYVDGLTFVENFFNPRIKLYAVYPNDICPYVTKQFKYSDVDVKIKTISLDDFKKTKKYSVSFLLSNFNNLFSVVDETKTQVLEEALNCMTLLDILDVIKDKAYNSSLKLDKEVDLTYDAKIISVRLVRLFSLFFKIVSHHDIQKAFVEMLEEIRSNKNLGLMLLNEPITLFKSSSENDITFDIHYFKEIIDKNLKEMTAYLDDVRKRIESDDNNDDYFQEIY